jgi:hypothetical protein
MQWAKPVEPTYAGGVAWRDRIYLAAVNTARPAGNSMEDVVETPLCGSATLVAQKVRRARSCTGSPHGSNTVASDATRKSWLAAAKQDSAALRW